MSVNWLWKDKIGEVVLRDKDTNQIDKVEMFTGNAMCILIYRYERISENTGKKEKHYNFITFFNDIKQAKLCLKDDKIEDLFVGDFKVIRIKLKVTSKVLRYTNDERLKFAKLLTEKGYKVILY